VNAAIFGNMKIDYRRAPARKPTLNEVIEFARVLAVDAGITEKMYLDLIHHPTWATPPSGVGKLWLEWAQDIKVDARNILTELMAMERRPKIKRRKKIKKPALTRFWTRHSLKHAQKPPARRRNYLPPIPTPTSPAPPGNPPMEETSAQRPCRRDRETLLFPTTGISPRLVGRDSQTLFDIRIAA
jgi:hypothetical protein